MDLDTCYILNQLNLFHIKFTVLILGLNCCVILLCSFQSWFLFTCMFQRLWCCWCGSDISRCGDGSLWALIWLLSLSVNLSPREGVCY